MPLLRNQPVGKWEFIFFTPSLSVVFGGAIAMRKEHCIKANGYSNSYFGWGAEDDDLASRITNAGLRITRWSQKISHYTMIEHTKEQPSEEKFVSIPICSFWFGGYKMEQIFELEFAHSTNSHPIMGGSKGSIFLKFSWLMYSCSVMFDLYPLNQKLRLNLINSSSWLLISNFSPSQSNFIEASWR